MIIIFGFWTEDIKQTNQSPIHCKFFILNKHFPTLMYVEGSDHLDVLVWLKNGRMSGILDGGVMVKVVV